MGTPEGQQDRRGSTRMVPAGPELRIYYCGKFHRSEVVRDGRNVGEVTEEAQGGMAGARVGG